MPFQAQRLTGLLRRRFPTVKLRRGPTGQYNCFGMAFASRRTGIWGSEASDTVRKVLLDDGYKSIALSQVQPGDLVLYIEGVEIIHAGIILEITEDTRLVGGRALVVLSKWAAAGEYIHATSECDYVGSGRRVTYWSDKDVNAPR